ncbi:MAG: tetratricopeptide repeat protein [Chromatiales bacterium]|nr:tetratricopeptide repeat protein [Chromatiales bacterium]
MDRYLPQALNLTARFLQRLAGLCLAGTLMLAGCTLPPQPDERPVEVVRPLPAPEPLPPRPQPSLPEAAVPPIPLPEPVPEFPALNTTSEMLIGESRRHQSTGNLAQAASSIERALRLDPRQPLLWLELGEIHLVEGDFAQAEAMARRALGFAGNYSGVHERAERLLFEARRSRGSL